MFPQIVVLPLDQMDVATRTLIVNCSANGIDTPTITWSNGSQVLSSEGRVSITDQMSGEYQRTSILTISDALVEDSATYTCNASNSEGSVSEDFEVVVVRKLLLIAMHFLLMICGLYLIAVQEIITEPASQVITVHQPTQFKCRAYIRAEILGLTLIWTDTNTGLAVSEEDGFKSTQEVVEATGIILVTSVLSFCGATEPISYALSCTANVLDINITRSFNLSVIPGSGMYANNIMLIEHM